MLFTSLLCLQWNGQTSNKDERYKAVQYLQGIKSERGGKPQVETLGNVLFCVALGNPIIATFRFTRSL